MPVVGKNRRVLTERSWEDAAAFLPVSEVFVDDKASDESLLRRRLPELLFAGGIECNE